MTYHPTTDLADLFVALHAAHVTPDGKTISDAELTEPPAVVLARYHAERDRANFSPTAFFREHFVLPTPPQSGFEANPDGTVTDHIERLWPALTRPAETTAERWSSRLPLPHPYVVPGGRFNEIYYWDSFFTMLGLRVSGKTDLIRGMLDNFAHLIERYGHIPNGNRTYFLSRSQPPFFAQMVRLLMDLEGDAVLATYRPALEREYAFWCGGANNPRVIEVNGVVLNRYYDNEAAPRAEMYQDDVELLARGGNDAQKLLLDLRAACESGWDFSSRWCADPTDLATIRTTDLLPVDLNCLLLDLERLLGIETRREQTLRTLFWNEFTGYFHDRHHLDNDLLDRFTLAGVFPLYFKIATQEQADHCAEVVRARFLADGGVLTTDTESGQQWDAPNGWAPLQYLTVRGLEHYGHHDLADQIRTRWLRLNEDVFRRTGKMMEKYNVMDTSLTSGGGEYDNQEGFGWTNGVYLALSNEAND